MTNIEKLLFVPEFERKQILNEVANDRSFTETCDRNLTLFSPVKRIFVHPIPDNICCYEFIIDRREHFLFFR